MGSQQEFAARMAHAPEGPPSPHRIDILALRAMFSGPVSAAVAHANMPDPPLAAAQEQAVRRWSPRRRDEFVAGRACAREALQDLGIEDVPIGVAQDRSPMWPAGVVGSITHCTGFCAAVVARASEVRGLGLDAEPATPLNPSLVSHIARPDEIISWGSARPGHGADWGKLAFCAKEAVYKAYRPSARTRLDFHDVSIAFSRDPSGAGGPFETEIHGRDAPSVPALRGRWRIVDGLALAAVTWTLA